MEEPQGYLGQECFSEFFEEHKELPGDVEPLMVSGGEILHYKVAYRWQDQHQE
ncbi:hypothetical protein FRC18_007005, partial [Serendipita sp. 400]